MADLKAQPLRADSLSISHIPTGGVIIDFSVSRCSLDSPGCSS